LKGTPPWQQTLRRNLAYSVRDDDLQQQRFAEFGTVTSAKGMMDRDTGRSKGFGFVEMARTPRHRPRSAA
jgi:RNA recognition motif-containing protein